MKRSGLGGVARAFGFDQPPATFEAFWTEILRTFTEGLDRESTLAALRATDRSPHRATADGDTQRYRCVTDGFVLGTVLDERVAVRAESPVSGTESTVEFDADGVASVPGDAQLSFGVPRSVSRPEGAVTPEKMYGRFCPYSNAFASREEYERWAADNPDVVSDVHPLDEALAIQARLLDGTADGGDIDASRDRTKSDCACCGSAAFDSS